MEKPKQVQVIEAMVEALEKAAASKIGAS